MKRPAIMVVRADATRPAPRPDEIVVGSDEVRQWLQSGALLRHVWRYGDARLLTYRMRLLGRPLFLAALVRAMGRGRCRIEDELGAGRDITISTLAHWVRAWVSDRLRMERFVANIERQVAGLERQAAALEARDVTAPVDWQATPVYLRTDLSFHLQAGGSVGHVAGVLNCLQEYAGRPVFITTDQVPTVDPAIETHLIDPAEDFWNFRELPALALNERAIAAARSGLGDRALSFLYHRYSVNSFAGVQLALMRQLPLVLEYNGSEVWVSHHWGERLAREALTERIERLNLAAARLLVVVSRPLADELIARGVDARKILINPNGVDPDRYSPSVDGAAVRARYELNGTTVVGFIGTFGVWHGAEVLARAFARLVSSRGTSGRRLRLLMIGDGVRLDAVKRIVSDAGVADMCAFTGIVRQEDGPDHLAACDVLVAPHVPNPDGSPFFGSPTKLFEYMAMGKGIVASDLDQIGEVLEHGRTAWLVPPGDADGLARGIEVLVNEAPLRAQLGRAARERVLAAYTWRHHTRRTLDRLGAMAAVPAAGIAAPPSGDALTR